GAAMMALDGTRTTWCETATSSETSTYMPASNSPEPFGISISVLSVRDAGSRAPDVRATRPLKTRGANLDEPPGDDSPTSNRPLISPPLMVRRYVSAGNESSHWTPWGYAHETGGSHTNAD